MRPDRKGGRRKRTLPAGGGGVRAASPSSSPPLGWGAGNPAPSPLPWSLRARLVAHREAGRGVRALGSGAHSHPWGVSTPGSAAVAAQLEKRCPSVSLRTGTGAQLRLSGNAAADADPARGAGRSRGGGRARGGETSGVGVPGAGGQAAGRPTRPLRPSPARNAPSRPPTPAAAAPHPYPPPYSAWEDPPPLLGRGPLADSRKSIGC